MPEDGRTQAPIRSKVGRRAHDETKGADMAVDDKVVIGQTHGTDDPESVLIGYLMGVEALRKGKQVVMWLTKDGVYLAVPGYAATVEVPDAPSVETLHNEFIESGGRFFACP